jgi:ketosteroid isomerase-like protein
VSDLDDFRTHFIARQTEAEEALVHGDPEPRMELWSSRDPVTVFGAGSGKLKSGWEDVSAIFRWIASTFSEVSDFRYDVEVADVSGDIAYTVGYERFTGSIDGRPVAPTTVRVTHVYRRENGEWKIVHRHGDGLESDQAPSVDREE